MPNILPLILLVPAVLLAADLQAQTCPQDSALAARVRAAEWIIAARIGAHDTCDRTSSRSDGGRPSFDGCRAVRYGLVSHAAWKGTVPQSSSELMLYADLPRDGGPAILTPGNYILLGFVFRLVEVPMDSLGRRGTPVAIPPGDPPIPLLRLGSCPGFILGPLSYQDLAAVGAGLGLSPQLPPP